MYLLLASFEELTGAPELLAYIFVFVIGAAIGSFLNVVIHRIPHQLSIVFPNSACPKCGAAIKPYDNIPVLSWLMLRGKCRACQAPISIRYPAVEFLTAVIFVVVYSQIGFSAFLPVCLILAATLIALSFIDAEHMILPNVITYPLIIFAFAVRIVFPLLFTENFFSDTLFWPAGYLTGQPAWLVSLVGAIAGAIAGGGFLWLVGKVWEVARGVEAMGLGDVKLMLGIGALLGWRLTILSVFLAAFVGAIVGIVLITRNKDKDFQTQIPFGVFLAPGSLIALLFGEPMIRWYISTFVP